MRFFSRRKYDELDDVSQMTESEKEKAILELEARRYAINEELELLMVRYSRLTRNRALRRRKYKMGSAPNDYKPGTVEKTK